MLNSKKIPNKYLIFFSFCDFYRKFVKSKKGRPGVFEMFIRFGLALNMVGAVVYMHSRYLKAKEQFDLQNEEQNTAQNLI